MLNQGQEKRDVPFLPCLFARVKRRPSQKTLPQPFPHISTQPHMHTHTHHALLRRAAPSISSADGLGMISNLGKRHPQPSADSMCDACSKSAGGFSHSKAKARYPTKHVRTTKQPNHKPIDQPGQRSAPSPVESSRDEGCPGVLRPRPLQSHHGALRLLLQIPKLRRAGRRGGFGRLRVLRPVQSP